MDKKISLKRLLIAGVIFVISVMAIYVKRWYFRVEWHSTLLPLLYQDEVYRGDVALVCIVSVLVICLCIIFSVRRNCSWLYILLFAVMPIISFICFEVALDEYTGVLTYKHLLCNIIIFYFLYLILLLITNSLKWTVIPLSAFLTFFSVVNAFVAAFRGKPVYPLDILSIGTAMDVAGQYTWKITSPMIMAVLVEIAVIFVWSKAEIKLPKYFRLISLALCAGAFFYINSYLESVYPSRVGTWGNGYAFDFSYAVKNVTPKKPAGYSVNKTEGIAGKYKKSLSGGDLPDNVIVIMNESWADLKSLGDFELTENPFEYYENMSENTVKGYVYTSVLAGNTANSEYEFLTGNTVANMPENVIAYQLYLTGEMPSLVSMFSDLGYETVSYHPQRAENYNRKNVYSWLGFDESLWEEAFPDNEYVRDLMTDSCDFRNVERIYENKKSDKLFVFNITSQSHGGFGAYPDFENTVHVKGSEGIYSNAEEYFTLADMTDTALEQLIDYFSKIDEKTVILMFGDHQPLLESEFYSYVGYNFNDNVSPEKYITNFFIWANYDIEESEDEMISVNFLPELLFETIGIEPAGYGDFLTDLYKEYPVVSAAAVYDIDGNMHNYLEMTKDGMMYDYACLQYNYIYDSLNRIKNFFWD